MASDFFYNLCQSAASRECEVVGALSNLVSGRGVCDLTEWPYRKLHAAAITILSERREFQSDIHELALQRRLYRRKFCMHCPACGKPDCSEAVPIFEDMEILHIEVDGDAFSQLFE